MFTRGKKALIAGGAGSREEHRLALEKNLQFERLEWASDEYKKGFYAKLAKKIRPGKYDIVFLNARFANHCSRELLKACHSAGIKLVYLTRGYSVNQVSEAIRQQALPRQMMA